MTEGRDKLAEMTLLHIGQPEGGDVVLIENDWETSRA